jgi:hypothetical protein
MPMNILKTEWNCHWKMESFVYLSILTNIQYLSIILEWYLNLKDTFTATNIYQDKNFYLVQIIIK